MIQNFSLLRFGILSLIITGSALAIERPQLPNELSGDWSGSCRAENGEAIGTLFISFNVKSPTLVETESWLTAINGVYEVATHHVEPPRREGSSTVTSLYWLNDKTLMRRKVWSLTSTDRSNESETHFFSLLLDLTLVKSGRIVTTQRYNLMQGDGTVVEQGMKDRICALKKLN